MDKIIGVRVDKKTLDEIKKRAKQDDRSVSGWVRKLISDVLDKNINKKTSASK